MLECSRCGGENPDDARFCNACGAPLAAATAAPREVRKTVTVVFSDVSGSTALGERLDPEAVRRVMGRWFEAARAELERHGGTVEKFVGDAVMAVFGVPTVHEDDALRAVRAAVGLHAALGELNEQLERDHGVRIQARTGVNTGEVVAGEGETLATGDAVNVAARLEQAASPGETLIGAATLALVRDAVETEPVEPLALKGKAEAVPAHRLVAVREDAAPFARRLDTPLVGRRSELAQLRQAYERAVRERTAVLFTLLGSAGIGKSRLADELLAEVDGEARVIRGRCLPYGEGITYWPLVEMLRSVSLSEVLDGEPHGELVAGRISAAFGSGGEPASPEETAWAVRMLFERLARDRPLVVLVDDLNWAEPTFLDLVDHVTDWSRGAPILLLCVARPDLLEIRPAWSGGKLNATTVLLEALSAVETQELIDALAAAESLPDPLRSRIAGAAEGNPLFIEQMLAMVREDGGDELPAPPTIQALLAARLDRLRPGERAVIERAAVEGKHFHRAAVAELSPDELRAEVDAHLLALVRKELIRPGEPAFAGEEAFHFRHLLIRDAAYDGMPKEIRADLHQRFAGWLERTAGGRVGELEELLGYHLEQAYRFRAELGPVGEAERALARRAAKLLLAGGRHAAARSDVPAARSLYERALELLPLGVAERPQALLDLAEILMFAGDFAAARAAIEEARSSGDAAIRARARLVEIQVDTQSDPGATATGALADAEEAAETLERLGDVAGAVVARFAAGRMHFFLGQAAVAEEAYRAGAELARGLSDQRLHNDVLGWWIGAALYGPTPVPAGLALLDELEAQTESAYVIAFASTARGQFLAAQGRFEEARVAIHRGLQLSQEFGMLLRTGVHPMQAGAVEIYAGDLEAAERELRRGDELLASLGETGFRSTLTTTLADVLSRLDRDDEAEALLEDVEAFLQEDDFDPQVRIRVVRGRIAARRREVVEGERVAREAVAISDATDYLEMRADSAVGLAEVLRLAGRVEQAAAELERALDLYERKGIVVMVERTRALLDELRAPA
jgi:class 3 adenylate cyclase/tetratricopeptide (TPR) repeat protein